MNGSFAPGRMLMCYPCCPDALCLRYRAGVSISNHDQKNELEGVA